MDNWERFDETSLPDKESFYSNLNLENIDDIDYRHGNNVFKRFKLKKLGEYYDLYVQSNSLLLADVFENFRNTCIKEIRSGICHSIHRNARVNNKYMENYDRNKESSYIQYLDANNLYGQAMSQKLPVNEFKWVNNEINEELIKNYDGNRDKGYIFEVDVKYKKKITRFT